MNEATEKQTQPTVATVAQASAQPHGRSAIMTLANRLGVEPGDLFLRSLRQVAFRSADVNNEQLMALVVVANQYKLNPFTRELYAFPDRQSGGIVPVVSVDGWLRIINDHPQNDGLAYKQADDNDGMGVYGECTIWRKDRTHELTLREYLKEVVRNIDTWRQYPSRMLRHKTIIQTGRVAFGFAGIYEPDEAERIIEARPTPLDTTTLTKRGVERLNELLQAEKAVDPNFAAHVANLGGKVEKDERPPDIAAEEDEEAAAIRADRQRGGSDELPI